MNQNKDNKIKQLLRNKYVKYTLILLVGLLLGRLLFPGAGGSHSHDHDHEHHDHEGEDVVWTCSMHPQIRQDEPGLCPLCAMDLVPLATSANDDNVHPDAIQLSATAVGLANIQTTTVSRQHPVKEIQLYGTIQPDERLAQSQTSHVNGRIEQLMINFTGESVQKGQTIALVYSPDLVNAQQELLQAQKMESIQPGLLDAAKEKLRNMKISDQQIESFLASGTTNPLVEIKANTSGIVTAKNVNQGDYISQGSVLLNVANLSQVWALFEAYESDLPFLRVGDPIEFTLQALPGQVFNGKISFIDPLLNRDSRTAQVRVVIPNGSRQLKPEMYATASVSAALKQHDNQIVIPKSAVLWTGKRSIVYVKQPDIESSAFLLREVDLGPSLGDAYVVMSGIEEGEDIVTNGVFTIDATAQLEGKQSMMNRGDEPITARGEQGTLTVGGSCDMCTDRIVKTTEGIIGVYSAQYDLETQQLQVDYNSHRTSLETISQAIAAVGHDTNLHKADDEVYEALPGCCHYR